MSLVLCVVCVCVCVCVTQTPDLFTMVIPSHVSLKVT